MTLIDLIIIMIIAGLVTLAVKKVLKDKAEGRCTGCSECSGACGGCHAHADNRSLGCSCGTDVSKHGIH